MKSATISYNDCISLSSNFNPRTHEECDGTGFNADWDTVISIHAPMKSATILMIFDNQ